MSVDQDKATGWAAALPHWRAGFLATGEVVKGFRSRGYGRGPSAKSVFTPRWTGYEEILTDPSYAGQDRHLHFPHIGNVGANDEERRDGFDLARSGRPALGAESSRARHGPLQPSSAAASRRMAVGPGRYRAQAAVRHPRIGRPLIREKGMPNAVIAHSRMDRFDF